MNVTQIVKQYLCAHKYDGLFNENGECACKLDDLQPCGEDFSECKAGVFVDCLPGDFHIGPRSGEPRSHRQPLWGSETEAEEEQGASDSATESGTGGIQDCTGDGSSWTAP